MLSRDSGNAEDRRLSIAVVVHAVHGERITRIVELELTEASVRNSAEFSFGV